MGFAYNFSHFTLTAQSPVWDSWCIQLRFDGISSNDTYPLIRFFFPQEKIEKKNENKKNFIRKIKKKKHKNNSSDFINYNCSEKKNNEDTISRRRKKTNKWVWKFRCRLLVFTDKYFHGWIICWVQTNENIVKKMCLRELKLKIAERCVKLFGHNVKNKVF